MTEEKTLVDRRTLIKMLVASGALGSVDSAVAQSSNPLNTIATDEFADTVIDTTYTGQEIQQTIHSQSAHGYPQEGDSYVVMSSGNAQKIFGDPDEFQNVDTGGIQIQNYSPDGYVANDVATFVIEFVVPEGVKNVAFDYKFGTEENPTYLDSKYQDFFEAVVLPPDKEPRNIALLPDGSPVTVQNSDSYANSPEGDSQSPDPPFPSSPDTVFNSVTERQTAVWNVSEYQGQQVTMFLRIADASDFFLDSAVFVDNLRFTGNVQNDPSLPRVSAALDEYEEALFGAIDKHLTALASAEANYYSMYGSEYASTVTDYLAYKAGDGDPTDVDDELRTLLDEGASSLDASSASELQAFYEDMYDTASPDMSESQLTSLFYQYYRGTADDQSSYIRFDTSGSETDSIAVAASGGQTLDEIITFTQDCIVGVAPASGLKEEIIQELAASELSAAAIGRFAQTVEEQTRNLNNQIEVTRTRYNETADNLTTDEEFNAKLVVPDTHQSATQSGQVEPQLALTGAVGGFAIKTLLTSSTAKAASLTIGAGGISLAGANYFGASSSISGLSASTYTGGQIAGAGSVLSSAQSLASVQTVMHYTRVQAIVNYLKLVDTATGALECGTTAFQDLLDAVDAMKAASDANGDLPNEDIIGLTITDVTAANIGAEDQIPDSNLGRGSGSATITNNGVVPIQPDFSDSKVDETIAYTSIQTGTEHPLVFEEIPEIQPGESETIEFTYLAPVGGLFELISDYEIKIVEHQTGASERVTFDTEAIDFNLDIPTTTVDQGSISTGETASQTLSTKSNASQSTLKLSYERFDGDLHLYDQNGNHCGFDYEAGEVVNEIPGATYFGDDNGTAKQEYITISEPNGSEYTVEVTVEEIGTVIQSVNTTTDLAARSRSLRQQSKQSEPDNEPMAVSPIDSLASGAGATKYTTELTELVPQPGVMSVSPVSVVTTASEEVVTSLTVSEVGTFEDLQNVELSLAGDLEQTDGSASLDQDNVTFEGEGITITSGESTQITVTIVVPDGVSTGTYEGNVNTTASSPSGSVTKSASLTVEVVTSNPIDGVTQAQFDAVLPDGTDTTLGELRTSVDDWVVNQRVDGVALTLGELRRIVNYWAANR